MHGGSFRFGARVLVAFTTIVGGHVLVGAVGATHAFEPLTGTTPEQIETAMDFDPSIECWYNDQFPQLDAGFDPAGPFAQNRLYFRCTLYPDYYFVDLTAETGFHRAVVPMAVDNCPSVDWYVEVVRPDFTSSRSETFNVPVTTFAECRRRNPGVAFFQGDPQLVVGTTGPGLSLLGFKPAGVVSFLTAAGELIAAGGATGGGFSAAAFAGTAAAGATVAVLGATAGEGEGGGEETPAPAPDPAPTPPPTTPTIPTPEPPTPQPPPTPEPPAPSVEACVETEPRTPKINVGDAVEFDARCSTGTNLQFRWEVLEDGRVKVGNFVNFRFGTPGTFTVELTVTQPATPVEGLRGGWGADEVVDFETVTVTVEEAPPDLEPCFTTRDLNPGFGCHIEFDAGCSQGAISEYEWVLDETNAMGLGQIPKNGKVVSHDWTDTQICPGLVGFTVAEMSVRLTVKDRQNRSVTGSFTIDVTYLKNPFRGQQTVPASFMSYLGVAPFDGQVAGQVRHNAQQVDVVNNAAPTQHNIQGSFGENELEAYTTTPTQEPGYWRFDFSNASDFEAGSLKAISGDVLSVTDRVIVFRLNGQPGEILRFRYQLTP